LRKNRDRHPFEATDRTDQCGIIAITAIAIQLDDFIKKFRQDVFAFRTVLTAGNAYAIPSG
jgi:hypothetical protein